MLCNGGLSGQHFLNALARSASDEGYKVGVDFGGILYDKKALSKYDKMDYLFLFAPATEMTRDAIETSYMPIHTVLLAPQVRYLYQAMSELFDGTEIKCIAIEPITFAEMAVKELFSLIK